ncbi:sigma-54-dependent Fis family transcriptional regulator [Simkania negevensis]|uniref:Sigma-54-dependent Fis family transcriptional regulator n=1 Tax=Simkania negevensis TaxID=83561 RepID=A0ABS3AWL3_9BACT|nr:sigma-54-dependent Fis family transcriptional regulator [Simkania negevensis]
MSIEKVLVVDDEVLIRSFLIEALGRQGYEVTGAESGEKAVQLLKEKNYDLVITDMKMPGLSGMDVLRKIKELAPSTVVIIMTAFGSIENAVEAMSLGAFNYLIKPFSPDTIEAMIQKAKEHRSLVEENNYLRSQVRNQGNGTQIIATSPIMKKIIADVKKVAASNATIFISGESGTGKEVIAHAIHHHSQRSSRPYIRVNCAAIPETLIESEFFGHEKGSFTGAHAKRIGRFELAHEGTLLLDEITEIPIGIQAKLLRVIQEMEFERVGGHKPIKVDVRLVSTTNRDMRQAIADNLFRKDLYYRLNVVPIFLPPLRDRREDIIPFAEYFLAKLCQENHKKQKRFSKQALKSLLAYPWPGNIRELANTIERAIVMDYANVIEKDHLYLPEQITAPSSDETGESFLPIGVSLRELEKRFIIETLQAKSLNKNTAAQTLGITTRTLRNKLKEYHGGMETVTKTEKLHGS